MGNVTFGEVNGDECGHCKHSLDLEGEFFEGQEVECTSCGAINMIEEIEATYEVYMSVVEEPPEEEEDEDDDEEKDSEEDDEEG